MSENAVNMRCQYCGVKNEMRERHAKKHAIRENAQRVNQYVSGSKNESLQVKLRH